MKVVLLGIEKAGKPDSYTLRLEVDGEPEQYLSSVSRAGGSLVCISAEHRFWERFLNEGFCTPLFRAVGKYHDKKEMSFPFEVEPWGKELMQRESGQ